MALSNADRQRRHRWRQACDKILLHIEVDETRLAAVFADEGTFLHTENPTREELATAVADFIDTVVTRYEQEKGWVID